MATSRCVMKLHWGHVLVFSKFILLFLDAGIAKSFGVLIPGLVERLGATYAKVGLICTLPSTLSYIGSFFVIMFFGDANGRVMGMVGGAIMGFSLIIAAFITNTAWLGVCFACCGMGSAMTYMYTAIAVNDFFPENFVMMNTLTLYGATAGATILPIIIERSLDAYGQTGALLILGGISLHTVACGATIRKPPPRPETGAKETNTGLDELDAGGATQSDDENASRRLDRAAEGVPEESCDRTECVNNDETTDTEDEMCQSHTKSKANVHNGHRGNMEDIPLVTETDGDCAETKWRVDKTGASAHLEGGRHVPSMMGARRTSSSDVSESSFNMSEKYSQEMVLSQRVPLLGGECKEPSRVSKLGCAIKSLVVSLLSPLYRIVVKESLFMFTLPAVFFVLYSIGSWMLFLVPHAEQLGIPRSRAVVLSTIGGLGGIFGRTFFIAATFKDIFDGFSGFTAVTCICTLTFCLDFVGSTYAIRATLAFVQGFCFFILDIIPSLICKKTLVDGGNFGVAYGLSMLMQGIGITTAGLLTGHLIDITQSYTKVFMMIGFILGGLVVHQVFSTLLIKRRLSRLQAAASLNST